jgi:hypothetical protein
MQAFDENTDHVKLAAATTPVGKAKASHAAAAALQTPSLISTATSYSNLRYVASITHK